MITMVDEAVLTCPMMPTGTPNVAPMSIRSSPVSIPGVPTAKKEKAREGRVSLPGELDSTGWGFSSFNLVTLQDEIYRKEISQQYLTLDTGVRFNLMRGLRVKH
jgi:hypothetical protein